MGKILNELNILNGKEKPICYQYSGSVFHTEMF